MLPESKSIKSELLLRDMSLSDDVKIARKSLIRWVALSLGLIMENESRRLVLDIIEALVYFHAKKEQPTTAQIITKMEELTGKKQNPKAVYYHLLKLKEAGILSRKKGAYFFGDGSNRKLSEIMREHYFSKANHCFVNISEALDRLEGSYNI
jgi:repressor of nif and glnA expression